MLKTFDISEKEAVRLCIIWLGRKLNEINFKLTKCKRIGQEQLAREWSKEYDGSGSKLKKLKEASHAAYEDAAERAQSEVQKRQEAAEQMKWMAGAGEYLLTGDFESDLNSFILIEDMEEEKRMDKEFEQMVINENVKNEREKAIQRVLFFNPMFDREMAEDWVNEDARKKKEKEEREEWLENATDEEMIDNDWWEYFFYRCFYHGLDPIWTESNDWEELQKRKPNETAQEYEARAYPPEYVKEFQEKEKKEKEQLQAKREEEEKQKKLRKKRDLINDITTNIEWTKKRLEELKTTDTKKFSERRLESHLNEIKDIEDRQIPYLKAKLTDNNYLDLYWDELSQ